MLAGKQRIPRNNIVISVAIQRHRGLPMPGRSHDLDDRGPRSGDERGRTG
ncbi:hypothetical protein JKG47_05785 [Acidithiobacillus sp. MC6.1]|nr:hypothetical protein [Acidithiobacillus sp. MC6.1]